MLIRRWYPELVELDDECQRAVVTKKALRRLAFTGPCGFLLGAASVVGAIVVWETLRYGLGIALSPFLVLAIVVFAAQMLVVLVLRGHAGRRLRADLNELGHAVCVECGYSLTGNLTGICPECGHEAISPTVEGESTESPPIDENSV